MKEGERWTTPELVVLTRHKPEEAVLNGCKVHRESGPLGKALACGGHRTCDYPCSTVSDS
jgi:hypothetical protein